MMLDLCGDGEPEAKWTTDLNDADEQTSSITLGTLKLYPKQPGAAAVSAVGTGALIWQAGPALATALMASGGGCLREAIHSGAGIELGCGCSALPGVALALCGMSKVAVTDSIAVLTELRFNLAAYIDDARASQPSLSLEEVLLPEPLAWDDPTALAGMASKEGYSIVVAADCDYADILHSALLDAVSAALRPTVESAALFATAARCQRTLRLFLSRLRARGFEVSELSAMLERLPSDARPAEDSVRFFAARWRSDAQAHQTRERLVAACS
jgi:hypothetical protein